MAKKRVNPTQQEINEMYNQALEGDKDALDWMREYNTLMTKAANERVRYLKKTGFIDSENNGTAAYENLKEDLESMGNDKLIYRKNMTETELYDNMTTARKFLESKTSSVKGEKDRRENIIRTLTDKKIIDLKTSEQKQNFLDFLDSDAWEEMSKFYGQTNLMNAVSEGITSGNKIEDLVSNWNDKTNVDLIATVEDWKNESEAHKQERLEKFSKKLGKIRAFGESEAKKSKKRKKK